MRWCIIIWRLLLDFQSLICSCGVRIPLNSVNSEKSGFSLCKWTALYCISKVVVIIRNRPQLEHSHFLSVHILLNKKQRKKVKPSSLNNLSKGQ